MSLENVIGLSQDKCRTPVEKEETETTITAIPNDMTRIAAPVYLDGEQYRKLLDILEDKPRKVAKFSKVSKHQWIKEEFPMIEEDIAKLIDDIILPRRSTKLAAGYDFFMPFDILIDPGRDVVIPTGIRVMFTNDNFVLKIYPRSGLGFKYKVQLANTVGIIDADYFFSDNEGHIKIKICNNSSRVLKIRKGEAFCQGIFVEYGITEDDDETEKATRNGGFGSTTK